jgi:protein TonB
MSYLNQAHDPRRRATAIVTVGAVHAVLAVGLLTGLTVQFTRDADKRIVATNLPLDKPKPDPSPTPPPQPQQQSYTAPVPLQPLNLTTDTKPVPDPVESDPPEFAYLPTGNVEPSPPSLPPRPSILPKRAVPSNSVSRWISNADYPRRALIDEAEGSAGYRLVIGTNGRVSSCEVLRTTGHRALDDATCRLISDRARFEPATDDTGAKVVGTYVGSVSWQIPD